VPQPPTDSPMILPTYITNGITDGLCISRSARMSDACPSAQVPTDFPKAQKFWQDFQTFLVHISINFLWPTEFNTTDNN
jgi:hypothetical protein